MIEFLILCLINFYSLFLIFSLKKKIVQQSFFVNLKFCIFYSIILFVFYFLFANSFYSYPMMCVFFYNIILLYARKIILIFYFFLYRNYEFFFFYKYRKFFYLNIRLFEIKLQILKQKKFLMLIFYFLFFFFPRAYIYIIFILLYVDVPFSEFENDFDQALVGKNEDNEIIIYTSGILKLELYKKFLLDSKNSKLKFYYCDKENVVQLYWGKDFKYLKKLDNDFYSL